MATVVIEFSLARQPRQLRSNQAAVFSQWSPAAASLIGSAELAVTDTATAGDNLVVVPEPDVAGQKVVVHLKAVGGEAYVAIGETPDPATRPRHHLLAGEERWRIVDPGLKIGCIEAALAE